MRSSYAAISRRRPLSVSKQAPSSYRNDESFSPLCRDHSAASFEAASIAATDGRICDRRVRGAPGSAASFEAASIAAIEPIPPASIGKASLSRFFRSGLHCGSHRRHSAETRYGAQPLLSKRPPLRRRIPSVPINNCRLSRFFRSGLHCGPRKSVKPFSVEGAQPLLSKRPPLRQRPRPDRISSRIAQPLLSKRPPLRRRCVLACLACRFRLSRFFRSGLHCGVEDWVADPTWVGHTQPLLSKRPPLRRLLG